MNWLKAHLKDHPSIALSIPAVLCFMQFLAEIFEAIKHGVFDMALLGQLSSSANGFESVALFIIIGVLNKRNK